jgi:ornithine carbamoyltransferase
MDAAKKFAERNLPEDARDEFIGLARRNVMNNIISGEAVVGPKVYMEAPRQKQVIDRVQITAGKASKIDKAPRTKEIAREK